MRRVMGAVVACVAAFTAVGTAGASEVRIDERMDWSYGPTERASVTYFDEGKVPNRVGVQLSEDREAVTFVERGGTVTVDDEGPATGFPPIVVSSDHFCQSLGPAAAACAYRGTGVVCMIAGQLCPVFIAPPFEVVRVLTGGGDDIVYVRDGAREVVNCGPGNDLVQADPIDVVVDCEGTL